MRILFPLAATLILAACSSGGGGSTPTPTPSPVNSAPVFTGPANIFIEENSWGAGYLTATDPDGDTISYAIVGGADADHFMFTWGSTLAFNPKWAVPSFEAPMDANGDNVYELQVRASDGVNSTIRNMTYTITNSLEGITVKRIATGFNQPMRIVQVRGETDKFYVAEKGGDVWYLKPSTGEKTFLLHVGGLTTDGERGLLNVGRGPSLATSNMLYVLATGAQGAVEVREYDLTTGAMRLVLSTPHPDSNKNNGGLFEVGFEMYVGIGDGGVPGDPQQNAQNPNSRLGKILHLTFAGSDTSPPPWPAGGNPFAALGGDRYVYMRGFRNPTHMSNIGYGMGYPDSGDGAVQELNIAPDRDDRYPLPNFGWPLMEGDKPFAGTAPADHLTPSWQYSKGPGPLQGGSIIGGYVYKGSIYSLNDRYIFGDRDSNSIWTVHYTYITNRSFPLGTNVERRNLDFTPDVGTIDHLVSFGRDTKGNIYLVDFDGDIFMLPA